MQSLPLELSQEIINRCDSSTRASLFIVIKNSSPAQTGRCLAEQALIDGHYQLFLYAIERQPLLSSYYSAAVKGNLPEAIALLQNHNVKQSQKAVFHAVRYDRPEIFALLKRRDQGTYALKCCAIPDRDWLPKLMRVKDPLSKKLLYYAVKYGNLELVEKIVHKEPTWVTEEMLWLAKVKGHREIIDLLFNVKTFGETWIYVFDDFQLFERQYPDWKENILLHNSRAWTFGALEIAPAFTLLGRATCFSKIAWYILVYQAPQVLAEDNYNFFELFRIMMCQFDFQSCVNNQEMVPTHSYLIFFFINYEATLQNKKYGLCLPVFMNQVAFFDDYYTNNYEYASEYFVKPENLRITSAYGQEFFALWCEKNNIALEKSHLR